MTSSNSPLSSTWQRAKKDLRITSSLVFLSLLMAGVLLGPFLLPDPEHQVLEKQLLPPSMSHLMGTDDLGRDVLSRILEGGKLSLSVGIIATLVSLIIGTLYGCVSGYLGGKVDSVLMRIVDILYCLPYMFLVIVLMTFLGSNIYVLFIALGLTQWLTVARIVRGQVLSIKNEDFIKVSKGFGTPSLLIIIKHILPNIFGVVLVYATLTVPSIILQESFLSFLGLSVYPCTWGVLISEGKDYMEVAWWVLLFPSLFLTLSLLSLNFLGDGLRDAMDTKLKA
jgi:oligopeptide transport system permease protein